MYMLMFVCACICRCVCMYCIYNIYVLEEQDAVTTHRGPALKKRYEKRVGPISKKSLEK